MYGDIIQEARASLDYLGRPSVMLLTTNEQSIKWAELTGLAAKERFAIAIVLDGVVLRAPMARQSIEGGRSEISGNYTKEQSINLAMILSAGTIPELKIVQLNQQSHK